MGHRETETWAGAMLTLVVVLLALPVALSDDAIRGPQALWWGVFVVHLVSLAGAMWIAELLPAPAVRLALTGMILSAPVLVALTPTAGWTPLVLIVSAAVCVYHLPLRLVSGVVAFNSVALLASFLSRDVPVGGSLLVTGFYALLQGASVLSAHGQIALQRSRTELAVANTELRAAHALLAESSRADERLRISRDLHDMLGHQLTALILELEVASHRTSGEAHQRVVKARDVARDLMADVRAAVGEQRAHSPDLTTALEAVVTDPPGLDIHLNVQVDLPPDLSAVTAIVRCAQEVVTNTLRHASAETLWIEVRSEGELIVLRAQDDGVGATQATPGNGLRGIIERAESLGGDAHFTAHDGFQVTARVPAR